MQINIWTLSNFISFLRILSTIPICWLLWNDYNTEAFFLALIGGALTDNLDGYFARKFNQITEFGKIIDPLADKIFLGAIGITMMLKGTLPVSFVAIILGRDLLILIAGLFISKRIKFVPPSNIMGKFTVTVVGINIAFYMLNWHPLADYTYYLSIVLLVLSLVVYTKTTVKLLKESK